MNRFLKFSLIFFLALINTYPQTSTSVIPDLDGRTPTGSYTTEQIVTIPRATNDFTIFTNFPVQANYLVFSPKTGAITCNMDSDPELEIVFGSGQKLYAINPDTTSVPGWPKTYAVNWEAQWAPSFGDIDGDSEDEIIAGIGGALGGKIYAYEKNGTDVPGFPITTGKYPMTPSLADIDNNGTMEIITGDRNYRVYVYKGDGTVYPGWPKMMDRYTASTVSIGDIDNNGTKEIFAESRNRLYAYDKDGNSLPGFPFTLVDTVNGSNSYSGPVLADLDKNGIKEIIFCAHDAGGVVYVVKSDGTNFPGFPKNIANWIYGAPSVYDMDGDGYLDILVGEYGSSTTPAFYIYCYKKDGTQVTGFPKGPFYGIANQITVANLDGDTDMEIMFDQNIQFGEYGVYYAYNMDNTPVTGFPINILKNTSFQQPVLTDLNRDLVLDIIGTSFNFADPKDSYIFAYSTGLSFDSSKIPLPVYQYNNRHDGVYKPYVPVPVELLSFTGSYDNNKVELNWITSSEINNSHFNLYRNNENIATITGNGTSTEKHSYSFIDVNFKSQNSYTLEQVDYNGTVKTIASIEVNTNLQPAAFELKQNYPNPFNPTTEINFSVPKSGFVTLKVYDVLGSEVSTLLHGYLELGNHKVNFNGTNLKSGTYFYELNAGEFHSVKKMMLIK